MGALSHLDHTLLGSAAAWRAPWLDEFFLALTWLGSLWLLLPASVLAGFHAYPRVGRISALLVAMLPLVVAGVCSLIKMLVDRDRPRLHEAVAAIPTDAAFPSAHAAQSMAVAVALAITLPVVGNYRIAVPLALLVLLVGCSRIYLQVHWPSDVLAGWLVGAVITLLIFFPVLKERLA
jgi:undecaprenyl-diphosphatase